jgi:hypothetical protein
MGSDANAVFAISVGSHSACALEPQPASPNAKKPIRVQIAMEASLISKSLPVWLKLPLPFIVKIITKGPARICLKAIHAELHLSIG